MIFFLKEVAFFKMHINHLSLNAEIIHFYVGNHFVTQGKHRITSVSRKKKDF